MRMRDGWKRFGGGERGAVWREEMHGWLIRPSSLTPSRSSLTRPDIVIIQMRMTLHGTVCAECVCMASFVVVACVCRVRACRTPVPSHAPADRCRGLPELSASRLRPMCRIRRNPKCLCPSSALLRGRCSRARAARARAQRQRTAAAAAAWSDGGQPHTRRRTARDKNAVAIERDEGKATKARVLY